MRTISLFILCLMTGLGSANTSVAKEWRGIKPLSSTRADVARLLGAPQQCSVHASFYSLPDGIAVVWFQSGPCDQFGLGWRVPSGTVTEIGVIPKADHQKEKFLAGSKFVAQDTNAGFFYYTDKNEGFTVETFKGVVTSLEYGPTGQEDERRCPMVEKCCFDFLPRFDEYDNLSFEDEKARLDNYVIVMGERMNRGVIVVYGPTPKARSQLMKRARRAQKYLAEKRGIENHRILLADGGNRESAALELSLYTIGGLGSHVYLFRNRDPK